MRRTLFFHWLKIAPAKLAPPLFHQKGHRQTHAFLIDEVFLRSLYLYCHHQLDIHQKQQFRGNQNDLAHIEYICHKSLQTNHFGATQLYVGDILHPPHTFRL